MANRYLILRVKMLDVNVKLIYSGHALSCTAPHSSDKAKVVVFEWQKNASQNESNVIYYTVIYHTKGTSTVQIPVFDSLCKL